MTVPQANSAARRLLDAEAKRDALRRDVLNLRHVYLGINLEPIEAARLVRRGWVKTGRNRHFTTPEGRAVLREHGYREVHL